MASIGVVLVLPFAFPFQAERDRPAVEPLPVEWNVALRPAESSGYVAPDLSMETVQLKKVPAKLRPTDAGGESTYKQTAELKEMTDEERRAK